MSPYISGECCVPETSGEVHLYMDMYMDMDMDMAPNPNPNRAARVAARACSVLLSSHVRAAP